MAAWQVCSPSHITHFDDVDVTIGAQACPVGQPKPTIVAAQKRPDVPQVATPGVAVPWGAHEPLTVGVNVPAWMPAMVPKLLPTQFGVVHACVELNVISGVPALLALAQSAAVANEAIVALHAVTVGPRQEHPAQAPPERLW